MLPLPSSGEAAAVSRCCSFLRSIFPTPPRSVQLLSTASITGNHHPSMLGFFFDGDFPVFLLLLTCCWLPASACLHLSVLNVPFTPFVGSLTVQYNWVPTSLAAGQPHALVFCQSILQCLYWCYQVVGFWPPLFLISMSTAFIQPLLSGHGSAVKMVPYKSGNRSPIPGFLCMLERSSFLILAASPSQPFSVLNVPFSPFCWAIGCAVRIDTFTSRSRSGHTL
jgi:hypothetical protein